MDLSNGPNCSRDKYLTIKKRSGYLLSSDDPTEECIELDAINLEDEETWLYCADALSGAHEGSAHDFLHGSPDLSNGDSQRNINTKTFTRPKKRVNRPSIEKYNQELYGGFEQPESPLFKPLESAKAASPASRPLQFDLAQPTSSFYLENLLLARANEADSFQSMSPPASLVNSMSSSIFTSLMDSSLIRNDPELREIRDKDYTDTILLQDCEPPMFQSITDSISSVTSDSPEAFLKKINSSRNYLVNVSADKINTTYEMNATFDKPPSSHKTEASVLEENEPDDKYLTIHNYTTYKRTPKHTKTFRKSDAKRQSLNATFNLDDAGSDPLQDDVNPAQISGSTTITKDSSAVLRQKMLEGVKQINDLNKLSYLHKSNGDLSSNLKRNSIGSADSLDRMSSLSNSSRGSNKMLNMAEVDAIVEMQEKSLRVMSTPKANNPTMTRMLDNFMSPILPDSDASSNEDFKMGAKEPQRKLAQRLSYKPAAVPKAMPRPMFVAPAPPQKLPGAPQNLRGSLTNLHQLKSLGGSQSNLKTMGSKLKGSYTSLRPMSANLPVAPPPISHQNPNTTITLPKATNPNVTQVLESKVPESGLKPRMSSLPRPLGASGLPRPVSRIPGPRSNSRY